MQYNITLRNKSAQYLLFGLTRNSPHMLLIHTCTIILINCKNIYYSDLFLGLTATTLSITTVLVLYGGL